MVGAQAIIDETTIRGQITTDVALGMESWFRCGGSADMVFSPADFQDLQDFLKAYPADAPLMVLGGMANTIVRDGGIRGCVVRLGKAMADIEVQLDQQRIIVGAGALNGSVASAAAKNGFGGLEFLSGIPGSIGGAVRMNAGAYGTEMSDALVEIGAVDRSGAVHLLSPADLQMRYRYTALPEGFVVTHAVFQAKAEAHDVVRARLKEIKSKRNETQPIKEKTGGSTFANPTVEDLRAADLPEDMRAWQVVEKVGGRGLSIGGAQMSEKHCNFMVNVGDACAADLEALGDELIARAKDQLGLTLHWEIKRVGEQA